MKGQNAPCEPPLDATGSIDHSAAMRFTKWDYLAFPFLAALLIGVTYGALRLVGFFGLGILGLIIAFITVRMDLERDGGNGGHPSVLAEQIKARDRISRAEKAEFQAEQQWRLRPLFTAQIIATGFIILGFGFHFLL
ncbi:hypothetical protein AB4099_21215 [Bosea sp. 2KB_26]|uniref:hypothetical protein n=1 Tax=Bosea sp. 2KB_26 TaxID=3237475 RepID=UPI003F8FDF53